MEGFTSDILQVTYKGMDFSSFFADMELSMDKSEGHLYVIEYDDGIVKIGKTTSPKRRMYTLTRFRGEYHRINKAYITNKITKMNTAEKMAMSGLRPVFGSECFKIKFEDAIKRVKKVAGEGVYFVSEDFEYTRIAFPNIERPEDGMRRLFELMINQCRKQ